MDNIVQNIILGISLAAPLGPATIAIINHGLKHGFWSAFQTACGVVAADTTYALIVFFGLASFMSIPVVKSIVWLFGMVVLLYLGITSSIEGLKNTAIMRTRVSPNSNFFVAGFLINISNPLAVVWWLGVFGSLLMTSTGEGSQLVALLQSLSIVLGIALWHTFLSGITGFGKKIITPTIWRLISLIGGIFLVGFSLKFGYQAVQLLRALSFDN